ncbi:MAG: pyridoxal phosphate-dependent aminotransferase, partial [Promethearchaeota archaeon]
YPSYRSIPHAMNIKVKEVPILKGPKIIPMDDIIEDVQKKVSDKTRFFILNGPCNPTGQVIYHDTLKRLWDVLEPYENIIFLADDIYEQLIYPPATFESTVQFDPKLERTIIINGFSKSFSMTGYRLGYIISNQKFIERLSRFQQNSVTCATTFSQKAGEIALKSYNEKWPEYLSFRKSFINELNKRRKLIYKELKSIKNLGVNEPEGAFYIFPDISHYEMDSHKFVMDLIKEKNVVTTPGNVFGKNGEGHIRISFTRPINELKEAIDKIKEFIENFKS